MDFPYSALLAKKCDRSWVSGRTPARPFQKNCNNIENIRMQYDEIVVNKKLRLVFKTLEPAIGE